LKSEAHKVLIVVAGYKPAVVYGGPIYSVSALCEELGRSGVEVAVLTTNANGKHDFEYTNLTSRMVDGVEVQYCRRISGDPMSVSPAHTLQLIRTISQYDLVHIQGWWNWVAIMSLLVCKWYKMPHVLSPRGALSEYTFLTRRTMWIKKWLHKIFFKPILNRTVLHVTSEEESRKFRGVLAEPHIVSIPNIVILPGKSNVPQKHEGPLQLIFLGRIDPVKNLELLIASLHEVSFPYSLTIVGDGDPGYIAQIQGLMKDSQQMQMVGPVYDDHKFELLAKADLLVLLSHTENFGNVIIEALSQGTAVLVSKHVGSADVVAAHQLGWIIEPDKESCIESLYRIDQCRDQLEDIRLRAPKVIADEFNPATLTRRYITACYGIVNPKFLAQEQMAEIV
jgi:glycosyltransferase involved in cell wall biosynthesis